MSDHKIRVEPGDVLPITLPWSEVCMHMRVAGKPMLVEITTGRWPAAQLLEDGRPYSFPITLGEAGIFTDDAGLYVPEHAVHRPVAVAA